MNINDFLLKVAEQYDEADASIFTPQTRFKELADWSSLVALSISAIIDEEYNVSLKSDDLKQSNTIEELYNKVLSKLKEDE